MFSGDDDWMRDYCKSNSAENLRLSIILRHLIADLTKVHEVMEKGNARDRIGRIIKKAQGV